MGELLKLAPLLDHLDGALGNAGPELAGHGERREEKSFCVTAREKRGKGHLLAAPSGKVASSDDSSSEAQGGTPEELRDAS